MKIKESSKFGKRIAKAFLTSSSSHVYFFIQQAYKGKKWGRDGELMSWEDAVKILKEVIKER
jgi:membrane protease subunit (stomatin/prohibitin family)